MDTRAGNLRLGDVIRLDGEEIHVTSLELSASLRVGVKGFDSKGLRHFVLDWRDPVFVDEYARGR